MDDLHSLFDMAKNISLLLFTDIMLNDQLTENKTMNPIIAAIQQTMKGIYNFLLIGSYYKKNPTLHCSINHYNENLSIIYMIH